MFNFFKSLRRQKIRATPFFEEWRTILRNTMPLYRHLSELDRLELEDHIKVLLHEKKFVGAGSLEITEEMRLLVCAQAAILLLHREPHYFPNVELIVIYESTYIAPIKESVGGGVFLTKPQARIGESNAKSNVVVLAWDSVRYGAADPSDGRNVVLHEFAHQLDSEKGYLDGSPILSSRSAYRAWCRVMTREYDQLRTDIADYHQTFIDEYGATSPIEFFAVVTEAFFEKPVGMKTLHPQLYDLLRNFYQQDPAEFGLFNAVP